MIAIVGAGITGLAVSHYLEQAGVDHVVFEAASEPGGVIRTRFLDARVLECGPQRTRLTPPVADLVDELDLRDRLVVVPSDLPLYVYHGGSLHRAPLSAGAFVASDLLSLRGKARALVEPLVGRHAADETVGTFLSRCFGREAYERLLGPLFGGLYGSDPGEMYARHSLARMLRDADIRGSLLAALARQALRSGPAAPACSFRDGMATLPAALYARQARRVRIATPVDALRRRRRAFVLEAGGNSVEASRVVFTSPADATARLLREVAPDSAARLHRLRYNALAVVHLRADMDRRGFGYQVALTERLNTHGVTWNASLFANGGRAGVHTAFVGGAGQGAVMDEPDRRIGALARREFERVTGSNAELLNVVRTRMPAWDRSWAALDGLSLPDGLHLCTNYVGRPGIPGRLMEAKRLAATLAGASRA